MQISKKVEAEGQIKEKIFSSAIKLFVEKGYHNTKMPDIVKDAGVSTGAIYHYFSGKEDLARYIHQKVLDEFLIRTTDRINVQRNVKDKIYAYTKLLFEWAEEDPMMVKYLLEARPKEILDTCMSICSKEGIDLVMELVDEGFQTGKIKQVNKNVAAGLISGILTRLIFMRMDGLLSESLKELIDETTQVIYNGLICED